MEPTASQYKDTGLTCHCAIQGYRFKNIPQVGEMFSVTKVINRDKLSNDILIQTIQIFCLLLLCSFFQSLNIVIYIPVSFDSYVTIDMCPWFDPGCHDDGCL